MFWGDRGSICDCYDIEPVCYGANMDCGLRYDRLPTEDEMVERAILDIRSANKCKAIRQQYLLSPNGLASIAFICGSLWRKRGLRSM